MSIPVGSVWFAPAALTLLASLSEAGSLRAAGRAAGVKQPALTKQPARLEQQWAYRWVRPLGETTLAAAVRPGHALARADSLAALVEACPAASAHRCRVSPTVSFAAAISVS